MEISGGGQEWTAECTLTMPDSIGPDSPIDTQQARHQVPPNLPPSRASMSERMFNGQWETLLSGIFFEPQPTNRRTMSPSIASDAAAITAVAAQPNRSSGQVAVKRPMIRRLETITMIATISGTAATPLRTALQNSALIASS